MTSIVPRRQIEEIIALHEREPLLREVVVEGASDKQFFEWFLSGSGLPDVPVLEVSTIEVPPALVVEMGLEDGKRGRVITLAAALAAHGAASERVTCVADADFDWLLDLRNDCPGLLLTDFTCLEAYAFNSKAIQKIIKLGLNGFRKNAQTVLDQITCLLQELFLLRAANHVAKLGLDFRGPNSSGFSKSVRLMESGLVFDADKYLTALLQAQGSVKKKTEVLAMVAELRKSLRSDPRYQINGHDFGQSLAFYVRRHKGFGGTRPELIIKSLYLGIEMADLAPYPLFQALLGRMIDSSQSA